MTPLLACLCLPLPLRAAACLPSPPLPACLCLLWCVCLCTSPRLPACLPELGYHPGLEAPSKTMVIRNLSSGLYMYILHVLSKVLRL